MTWIIRPSLEGGDVVEKAGVPMAHIVEDSFDACGDIYVIHCTSLVTYGIFPQR